jgi:cell shape-determining protein MreC
MSTANQVPSDLTDEISLKRFLSDLLQRVQNLESENKALQEQLNKQEQQ